jgi:hypothetical protein
MSATYPIGNQNTASRQSNEAHGDEGGLDLAPHMENALELVIEDILKYGEYPQPRRVGLFITTGKGGPRQFDLCEFVQENIDAGDILESFVKYAICSDRDRDFEAMKWERKFSAMLLENLAGSEIVRERAEQLAEEAMEETPSTFREQTS